MAKSKIIYEEDIKWTKNIIRFTQENRVDAPAKLTVRYMLYPDCKEIVVFCSKEAMWHDDMVRKNDEIIGKSALSFICHSCLSLKVAPRLPFNFRKMKRVPGSARKRPGNRSPRELDIKKISRLMETMEECRERSYGVSFRVRSQ